MTFTCNDMRSGSLIENLRNGKTYYVANANYSAQRVRATQIAIAADGHWVWFDNAKWTNVKMAHCRVLAL